VEVVHTASPVEQPVSSLDGIVYSIRASIIVDFPQTKADLRHLVTIVERNVWSLDSHCCEEVAFCESKSRYRRIGSGFAGADRWEERVTGTSNKSEGAYSINTRTAKALGNHVFEYFTK
jgi:hypothetical protein